jgi:hypothetical protein
LKPIKDISPIAFCSVTPHDVGVTETSKASGVIRSIYMYGVCLITLITSLFAAVSGVSAVVDVAYPDPYVGSYDPYPSIARPDATDETATDPEALAEWETRQAELSQQSNRRNAIRGILRSIVTLAFAVPLFVLHWRSALRERHPNEEN